MRGEKDGQVGLPAVSTRVVPWARCGQLGTAVQQRRHGGAGWQREDPRGPVASGAAGFRSHWLRLGPDAAAAARAMCRLRLRARHMFWRQGLHVH